MKEFFLWYLSVTILGWLTFPLVYGLFPALSDRGYSLARTIGLLVWGYFFWLLASLGIAQNDPGGLILALLLLGIPSLWTCKKHLDELWDWVRHHVKMIFIMEGLFLLAFAVLAVVRAANPEILGTEKPMELAFINAILRSPIFPPRDPWLSGFGISYYYFGYVITAMLARITGVPGGIAFNLMLALVYALGVIGSYGIIHNIVSAIQKADKEFPQRMSFGLPFLGPFFLLVVSNWEGFLEVLHSKGIFWSFTADGTATSSFWKWLDIKDLTQAPIQPLAWLPDRYLWWWRASRVVQDTTLLNVPQELIDEFPVFSFILGDLHPHVLSIPFGILAIGVGLNLFQGGWRGTTWLFGFKIPIKWQGLLFPAVVLGGLAFMNTWDILIAACLVCGSFLLHRVVEEGWSWKRMGETLGFSLITGLGSILFYLPFYLGFSSQAGGILPNLVNPTRGAHLWVMFGPLFVPIFFLLFYLAWNQRKLAKWKTSTAWVIGLVAGLWCLTWLASGLVYIKKPDVAVSFLQSQGVSDLANLFRAATERRFVYMGGLLTLLILLTASMAISLGYLTKTRKENPEPTMDDPVLPGNIKTENTPIPFVLMLILLGGLLVLVPDFVYLRDQFGWRINTIFKFYYQAWILWGLMAAVATAVLLLKLRGWGVVVFKFVLSITLLMALPYTFLGIFTKTNNFKPPSGWNLNGTAYLDRENPDEALAIAWLNQAPDGVLVEAVGGSYSNFGRISTLTGLPTVLGWPGHEGQWRGSYDPQGNRQEDVRILYETSNWLDTETIIKSYGIRYVYIGNLERSTYRVNESKFQETRQPVYSQGTVVIYSFP
jgi:YYY domain-containing protein